MDETPESRIEELEDALKQTERKLAEMKVERDEALELIDRARENVEAAQRVIESFVHAFDMTLGADGRWHTEPDSLVEAYEQLVEKYNTLLKRWNKLVPHYNAVILRRPSGRPIGASEAQCATVLKLRRTGTPLRTIADETNLSLRTVRTVIGRDQRTDRTTKKRLERVDPMSGALASARARSRTRKGLPKVIEEFQTEAGAIMKAAKGIG